MAGGSTEPIQDIKPGDIVKSRDPETGKDENEPVLETFAHYAAQVLTIRLSDGETFTCTPDHQFFVQGKGIEPAQALIAGDALYRGAKARTTATVSAVEWQPEAASVLGDTEVYNLEIASTHTYFVGGADGGVWVHNGCTNVTWPGTMTPDEALDEGLNWVGDDYTQAVGRPGEPSPPVWRSEPEADGNIYQFRMQDSDLDGEHGTIGPHVHFQQFDAGGNELNIHPGIR